MKSSIVRAALVPLLLVGCGQVSEDEPQTRKARDFELVSAYLVLEGPAAVEVIPAGSDARQQGHRIRQRLRELDSERQSLLPAIEARGATVMFDLKRLVNAVGVQAPRDVIEELGRLPGVVRVDPVTRLEPRLASAVPLIGAPTAWSSGVMAQGDGIRIGIVDSGIDYIHADFGGPGTKAAYDANDPTVVEPGTFPTAKVVGGTDFVGDDYNPTGGSTIPRPDGDPLDCFRPESMDVAGGHGSHVAGIAAGQGVLNDRTTFAGPYEQSLDPSAFRVFPGVAPRAELYALKIFGCQGGTDYLAPALERAVDPNQDGDLSDRLDVVNASLGTSFALGSPAEGRLVSNLSRAGTLFVVAAGNDGNTFYATGSPSTYPSALSVAASADSDFLALSIDAPQAIAGEIPAAESGFARRLSDTGPISGSVVLTQPALACGSISNASALSGNIALIDRGTCTFVSKFQNAADAGAIAVIVADDEEASVPFAMGGDPGASNLPGVMITREHGELLKTALGQGLMVTLDASQRYAGAGAELIAPFSSRGPSGEDSILKPEIAAPGFSIDSVQVGSGSEPRRSQGTSMASPVIAGAAALVRQARPGLGPEEVKAALMNTAVPVQDPAGNFYPVSLVGAGRVDVARATATTLTASVDSSDGTVAASFGAIVVSQPWSDTRTLRVKNHGSSSVTLNVSTSATYELPGISTSVEPTTLDLPAGADSTVTLTLTIDPEALGAPGPDPVTPPQQYENPRHWLTEAGGHVVFRSLTGQFVVPYYASVRAAGERSAAGIDGCASGQGPLDIAIEGPSAHPEPVISAFQLGVEDPITSVSSPEARVLDLIATGAATDLFTRQADEDPSVFFGVAVAGDWTTPALGQYSRLGVEIDVNGDQGGDYFVFIEPLTRTGPYADVLAASTYTSNGQPTDSKRYLNIVPADVADTAPFLNSVVVLPVFLKDIGLNADSAGLNYRAFTQTLDQFSSRGEQTAWAHFDATRPALDTARFGLEGRPLFVGVDSLQIFVDTEAAGGTLPDLLLLHHNNVTEKRVEVVHPSAGGNAGNLSISNVAPETTVPGEAFRVTLTLTNDASSARPGVSVSAELGGGALLSASPSQGDCSLEPQFGCELGELGPGSRATIQLDIQPEGAAGDRVTLLATASATGGCNDQADDDQTRAEVTLAQPSGPEELRPRGGCGCRMPPAGGPRLPALLLAGLGLGVALGRRRRRR